MAIDIIASMRVFTAVVEASSFAGASDKLDLSRGMATRYVAQLETHLGVRLLNRTTRKLSLTEAGLDYYQHATQILAMVEESEVSAAQRSSAPRGILRVATSTSFGIHHMGTTISEYLRHYPDVQVDLFLDDRPIDLVKDGIDIALRFASKIDPGYVARRLAPIRVAACASPGYIKKHGSPKSPTELIDHNCLVYPHSIHQGGWHFKRKNEQQTVNVSGNLRCNNGDALVDAAIAGMGIIFEPSILVYKAINQGKLVRILPGWESREFSLYAVYPNRKYLPPKVRTFIDFIVERFGPKPYWDIF